MTFLLKLLALLKEQPMVLVAQAPGMRIGGHTVAGGTTMNGQVIGMELRGLQDGGSAGMRFLKQKLNGKSKRRTCRVY